MDASINPSLADARCCPRCGQAAEITFPRSLACPQCGYSLYFNPEPVAGAIPVDDANRGRTDPRAVARSSGCLRARRPRTARQWLRRSWASAILSVLRASGMRLQKLEHALAEGLRSLELREVSGVLEHFHLDP